MQLRRNSGNHRSLHWNSQIANCKGSGRHSARFEKLGSRKDLMNCVIVKDLENEFLDNSLPPEQRDAVEQHMQICWSCRRELEYLLGFRKSLRECREAPPQALETLVMGAVHRQLQRRPFWQEVRHNLSLW